MEEINMEDISLPHNVRVEDILASYFTKKLEDNGTESKSRSSERHKSSRSKKSKKRKHKKKKKHRYRKDRSDNEGEGNDSDSSEEECWVEVTAATLKDVPRQQPVQPSMATVTAEASSDLYIVKLPPPSQEELAISQQPCEVKEAVTTPGLNLKSLSDSLAMHTTPTFRVADGEPLPPGVDSVDICGTSGARNASAPNGDRQKGQVQGETRRRDLESQQNLSGTFPYRFSDGKDEENDSKASNLINKSEAEKHSDKKPRKEGRKTGEKEDTQRKHDASPDGRRSRSSSHGKKNSQMEDSKTRSPARQKSRSRDEEHGKSLHCSRSHGRRHNRRHSRSRDRCRSRSSDRYRNSSRDRYRSKSPDTRRSRSHGRRRSRSRDRRRSRSRDRRRSRSWDRRRSRSRDMHRSRSRSRRRSRGRDRRRSRSRDRHRSRSRNKHRSRSRDKHRSRSPDQHRSRSRDRRHSRNRGSHFSGGRDRESTRESHRRRSSSRDICRSRSHDRYRSRSRDRRLSRSPDRHRSSSGNRQRNASVTRHRSKSRDVQRSRSLSRKSEPSVEKEIEERGCQNGSEDGMVSNISKAASEPSSSVPLDITAADQNETEVQASMVCEAPPQQQTLSAAAAEDAATEDAAAEGAAAEDAAAENAAAEDAAAEDAAAEDAAAEDAAAEDAAAEHAAAEDAAAVDAATEDAAALDAAAEDAANHTCEPPAEDKSCSEEIPEESQSEYHVNATSHEEPTIEEGAGSDGSNTLTVLDDKEQLTHPLSFHEKDSPNAELSQIPPEIEVACIPLPELADLPQDDDDNRSTPMDICDSDEEVPNGSFDTIIVVEHCNANNVSSATDSNPDVGGTHIHDVACPVVMDQQNEEVPSHQVSSDLGTLQNCDQPTVVQRSSPVKIESTLESELPQIWISDPQNEVALSSDDNAPTTAADEDHGSCTFREEMGSSPQLDGKSEEPLLKGMQEEASLVTDLLESCAEKEPSSPSFDACCLLPELMSKPLPEPETTDSVAASVAVSDLEGKQEMAGPIGSPTADEQEGEANCTTNLLEPSEALHDPEKSNVQESSNKHQENEPMSSSEKKVKMLKISSKRNYRKSHSRRKSRSQSRDRESEERKQLRRSKHKHRKHRSRERSSSRDKEASLQQRSCSRSRKKLSRSRSRDRRIMSRSRSRDRKRPSRSCSRDGKRSPRSCSRDRRRSSRSRSRSRKKSSKKSKSYSRSEAKSPRDEIKTTYSADEEEGPRNNRDIEQPYSQETAYGNDVTLSGGNKDCSLPQGVDNALESNTEKPELEQDACNTETSVPGESLHEPEPSCATEYHTEDKDPSVKSVVEVIEVPLHDEAGVSKDLGDLINLEKISSKTDVPLKRAATPPPSPEKTSVQDEENGIKMAPSEDGLSSVIAEKVVETSLQKRENEDNRSHVMDPDEEAAKEISLGHLHEGKENEGDSKQGIDPSGSENSEEEKSPEEKKHKDRRNRSGSRQNSQSRDVSPDRKSSNGESIQQKVDHVSVSRRSSSKSLQRSPSKERSPKCRSHSSEKVKQVTCSASRKSRSKSLRKSRSRDRSPKQRSHSREKARLRSRSRSVCRKSRSRSRPRSQSRDRSSKRRSRSRARRKSSRDRSRERLKRRRSRSRSRSAHLRSRSRVKRRRSRSRARRRSSRDRSPRRRSQNRSWRRRSRSESRDRRRRSRSRPRYRSRSRRRSRDRRPSRSRSNRRSKSVSRKRSKSPARAKSRSRSSTRASSVEKIDKAQLLEAARRNVKEMMEKGTLPRGLTISVTTTKLIAKPVPEQPKLQNNSLADLTEFCKALSKEEEKEESGEVDPKDPAEEPTFKIHHPFKVKDPPPIRFNIPNATQLPVKTLAEKVAEAANLHKQFPVSSGNQHRIKELEWVPVEPDQAKEEAKADKKLKVAKARQDEATSSPLPLPAPPSPPSFQPVTTFSPLPRMQTAPVFAARSEAQMQPPVCIVAPTMAPVLTMEAGKEVDAMDLGEIMSRRLEALQRLGENPMDMEAMHVFHECHKQFQAWAQSKQQPGQYTGTVDFKPLTPEELCGPFPAWVRKDQFLKTAPILEGIGMHLLKKMGWNPGEGLGKNKEGSLEPLLPNIKTDKKGLVSEEETKRPVIPVVQELGGKHPVSALTEYCIKHRLGPPEFTLAGEGGPDHKKTFIFKVKVDGREFQPVERSVNKKHAKAQAALVCLQQLGLVFKGFTSGEATYLHSVGT